jgi:hypothetical protein
LVFGISSFAFAQTKTITNTSLEKYRQKRLQAEYDLRTNYAELGFPSPDELERQNVESSRERSELSQRLREERLAKESMQMEQERLNLERQYLNRNNGQDNSAPANSYPYPNPNFIDYSQYGTSSYGYSGYYGQGFYGNGLFNRNNRRNRYRDGVVFRFGRISPNVRNNPNRPTIRGDRRLNRLQRIQTQRGNRNVFPGVGVIRRIGGN